MRADLPKPEIRAKASSTYTLEDIDRRLTVLAGRQDDEAKTEVAFLQKLRQEMDGSA